MIFSKKKVTGALEFYEKKLFYFIHEFYFCNCIICTWKYFNRPFTNKRIIIFQDNGEIEICRFLILYKQRGVAVLVGK